MLQAGRLCLPLGPFVVRIGSDLASLARDIAFLYADFPLLFDAAFADFTVEVRRDRGFRRWLRPRIRFFFDGRPSFVPLGLHQAMPMLEWGINWCVAAHGHQYLIIHAAVVEKEGRALILPGPPGAGKSTLSAALVCRGWRLLSDELALYEMADRMLFGMARPINLKNESIEIMRTFAPGVAISRCIHNTNKGTIALMKPPRESVLRMKEPALPALLVVPSYRSGARLSFHRLEKCESFLLLAEQSFNYDIHGITGFRALAEMIAHLECQRLVYGDLESAVEALDMLIEESRQ